MHILKLLLINNFKLPIIYSDIGPLSLEHIYPKSFLNKSEHFEYHNIYSASRKINNYRSNYIFSNKYNNITWIHVGNNNFINHKKKLFSPRDEDKGIIARSILYMKYKYNYDIIMNKEELLEWCLLHKPNFNEILHNYHVKLYSDYHNDNIFITKFNDKKYYKFIKEIIYT